MLGIITNVLVPSLIASIGWGISPIYDKKALTELDNDHNTVFIIKMIFLGIFAFIFYLLNDKKINFQDKKFRKALKHLIISALLASLVGHYFFYKALSKSKYTTLVVLITYVLPLLFVTVLSSLFLNEKFNLGMICGMIICLMGITIFIYYSK